MVTSNLLCVVVCCCTFWQAMACANLANVLATSATHAAEIFARHGFCVLPPDLVGIDDAKLDALHEGSRFRFEKNVVECVGVKSAG